MPETAPLLYVFGPDGYRRTVQAEKLAPRPVPGRGADRGGGRGLFRVRPLAESRAFPEIGLYLPEPELAEYGENPALLQQIAAYTGGRFPAFAARGVSGQPGELCQPRCGSGPGLLALALVLNFVEVLLRRLRAGRGRRAGAARASGVTTPERTRGAEASPATAGAAGPGQARLLYCAVGPPPEPAAGAGLARPHLKMRDPEERGNQQQGAADLGDPKRVPPRPDRVDRCERCVAGSPDPRPLPCGGQDQQHQGSRNQVHCQGDQHLAGGACLPQRRPARRPK
jgi:hypothetical protein